MTKKGIVRRYFPGGNTCKGFFSYYDNILGQEEAKRIIVIKGGPGVGKSSFMKKIGKEMEEKGFDVEYHHCSSDNSSIDGVVFPKIGVALLDGTAPHIVDPKNPGAVDEIIHLGDYWDEEKMMENKIEILKINSEVGRSFKRAYGYLAAAKGVYDNIEITMNELLDKMKANKIIKQLTTEIFGRITYGEKLGKERHLFGSAITPDGVKDHIETLVNSNEMVFVLKGKYDFADSLILKRLGMIAVDKGYNVEYLHNHFVPEKVDHIIIRDISVTITNSPKLNNPSFKYVDVDSCLNLDLLKKREMELIKDLERFEELINIAIDNIKYAKKNHDILEKYYIPSMDFDAVDQLREKTIIRILRWAE